MTIMTGSRTRRMPFLDPPNLLIPTTMVSATADTDDDGDGVADADDIVDPVNRWILTPMALVNVIRTMMVMA